MGAAKLRSVDEADTRPQLRIAEVPGSDQLAETVTMSATETVSIPTTEEASAPQSATTADSVGGPDTELLAELAAASARLESATPEEIIAWSHRRFGNRLTMATAFGAEGCVLLSLLAKIAPDTYVFNLDTGYQFQQTLDLRDRIADKYGIEVDLVKPELSVPEYEARHGGPLYKTDPTQCCFDRKITVLRKALVGKEAWMSGIRREETGDRARASIVHWDKKFNLVKIAPLANWTKRDLWKRITDESIPYNPLHDQGYRSIGCWPCTRAVADGEDDRAGRWSGTDKTECGLHTLEADGSGI